MYKKHKLNELKRCQVQREVQIHLDLQHPNIIQLYAAFEDDECVYMVLELASEGDLFDVVKAEVGSKFSEPRTVCEVILPLLGVISFLHKRGIVHRDIKPENLLMSSGRVLKLADFGLSIDISEERPVTRVGTLDYMAPEVLLCPDKKIPTQNKDMTDVAYNEQVDSWAVGVLAYELLVGFVPFSHKESNIAIRKILHEKPTFPSWVFRDAVRFINAALSKDSGKRLAIEEFYDQPWLLPYMEQALLRGGSHRSHLTAVPDMHTSINVPLPQEHSLNPPDRALSSLIRRWTPPCLVDAEAWRQQSHGGNNQSHLTGALSCLKIPSGTDLSMRPPVDASKTSVTPISSGDESYAGPDQCLATLENTVPQPKIATSPSLKLHKISCSFPAISASLPTSPTSFSPLHSIQSNLSCVSELSQTNDSCKVESRQIQTRRNLSFQGADVSRQACSARLDESCVAQFSPKEMARLKLSDNKLSIHQQSQMTNVSKVTAAAADTAKYILPLEGTVVLPPILSDLHTQPLDDRQGLPPTADKMALTPHAPIGRSAPTGTQHLKKCFSSIPGASRRFRSVPHILVRTQSDLNNQCSITGVDSPERIDLQTHR